MRTRGGGGLSRNVSHHQSVERIHVWACGRTFSLAVRSPVCSGCVWASVLVHGGHWSFSQKQCEVKLLMVLSQSPEEMKGRVEMTTSALKGWKWCCPRSLPHIFVLVKTNLSRFWMWSQVITSISILGGNILSCGFFLLCGSWGGYTNRKIHLPTFFCLLAVYSVPHIYVNLSNVNPSFAVPCPLFPPTSLFQSYLLLKYYPAIIINVIYHTAFKLICSQNTNPPQAYFFFYSNLLIWVCTAQWYHTGYHRDSLADIINQSDAILVINTCSTFLQLDLRSILFRLISFNLISFSLSSFSLSSFNSFWLTLILFHYIYSFHISYCWIWFNLISFDLWASHIMQSVKPRTEV